ncbi:hypothetical protein BDN72DRAFT_95234 [Pluteus cervinus]|uniref:Uncharacterized protein n=1 Tax=Pluteus cervinus TaxID=181527 RepID=A0ACD3AQH5_9AGAR|nr:hypothetical protein BDN72DRAFT_95234 [Pluteus cervinus]
MSAWEDILLRNCHRFCLGGTLFEYLGMFLLGSFYEPLCVFWFRRRMDSLLSHPGNETRAVKARCFCLHRHVRWPLRSLLLLCAYCRLIYPFLEYEDLGRACRVTKARHVCLHRCI